VAVLVLHGTRGRGGGDGWRANHGTVVEVVLDRHGHDRTAADVGDGAAV